MGGDGQGDKPLVRFDVQDGVGVITIDNPPVNALAPGVRDGIVEAVEKGEADPNVKAIFATGFISPEIEAHLETEDLSVVIMKPYSPGEMRKKIATVLHKPTASPAPPSPMDDNNSDL